MAEIARSRQGGGEEATITGSLVTTGTTADLVIASYTVPAGRTLFLQYVHAQARSTVPPGNPNPVLFGAASLELPSGTKRVTVDLIGNVTINGNIFTFPSPLVANAGQIVRVVCTPLAVTSFTWRANFGGFLR